MNDEAYLYMNIKIFSISVKSIEVILQDLDETKIDIILAYGNLRKQSESEICLWMEFAA